jgi:demethylmenaquinone methyltransferase/2-methoxy-6-polyprenyl-1,4-benzoquinol methylase
MQNRYLANGGSRAPRVRELFSRIAWRYDLVNDLISFGMHRRWKRRTVKLALAGAPRKHVLDLCCGSGDLVFLAGEAGARDVVGADFTFSMLAVAARRKRAGAGTGRFVQADALSLPFPDDSFDAITISYGLRNVSDLPAALAEMRRVLVPGGRVAILDFGKPDGPIARALYAAYLGVAMPLVGWLFHGDADTYRYIPASLERYPGQRGVERLMREKGFENSRYENALLGTMGINLGEKAPRRRSS